MSVKLHGLPWVLDYNPQERVEDFDYSYDSLVGRKVLCESYATTTKKYMYSWKLSKKNKGAVKGIL